MLRRPVQHRLVSVLTQERRIATGDYGGQLAIWDFERDAAVYSAPKAHVGLINAIDGCGGLGIGSGAPEIVTGGADGSVRVWDPRVADCVLALDPSPGESKRDCWAVAFGNSFNDSERCVAAGYDNGDVKLFDLRTSTMRWETNASNGVVALEFDRRAECGVQCLCAHVSSQPCESLLQKGHCYEQVASHHAGV